MQTFAEMMTVDTPAPPVVSSQALCPALAKLCMSGSERSLRALSQALCSALAKMCVRELRTEAPNTSVFYMAAVSLVAAVIGCFLPMAWGDTTSFRLPSHWAEWLLLCGIGASLQHSRTLMSTCAMPKPRVRKTVSKRILAGEVPALAQHQGPSGTLPL